MANEKLTDFSSFSGCGAKLGPALLDKALCGLSQPSNPSLLVDFTTSDDAGVYRINKETALVQTVDFFPPMVDDPVDFGRIAAANALSDVYAMGGEPITAMSVVGFPQDKLPVDRLRSIMEGGLEKLKEAKTSLVGGHSVSDSELKFGFSVSGLVHPGKILRNSGMKAGDVLILTKPLGTGAVITAMRAGMVQSESLEAAVSSMKTLNRGAAEVMKSFSVSACTDVTGFGLGGHACEMVAPGDTGIRFFLKELALFPGTEEYLSMGLVPEGTYRNREFRGKLISQFKELSPLTQDLLFDPQTSGGLLFSLPLNQSRDAMARLIDLGLTPSLVGEVTSLGGRIEVDE